MNQLSLALRNVCLSPRIKPHSLNKVSSRDFKHACFIHVVVIPVVARLKADWCVDLISQSWQSTVVEDNSAMLLSYVYCCWKSLMLSLCFLLLFVNSLFSIIGKIVNCIQKYFRCVSSKWSWLFPAVWYLHIFTSLNMVAFCLPLRT